MSEQSLAVESETRAIVGQLPGISIVVPVFNEVAGIEAVLDGLKAAMDDAGFEYEVIVVDDASEDGSAELVKARGSQVRMRRHRKNRGYGASLKTGIRMAGYDLIGITDGDGTYPLARLIDLVEKYASGDCDMVVGARIGRRAAVPMVRRPAKWAVNRLASFVASEPISDVNSGLRVFRKSTAMRFFDLLPARFSFTTTLTLAMLRHGYLVEFMPIEYYKRVGRSKIRPISDTLGFLRLISRIALYFAPLKVFIPLSGLLLLLAVSWAAISNLAFGQIADASTAVIAMTAVQVAVVGLLAELVNGRIPYRAEGDHERET